MLRYPSTADLRRTSNLWVRLENSTRRNRHIRWPDSINFEDLSDIHMKDPCHA